MLDALFMDGFINLAFFKLGYGIIPNVVDMTE